MRDIPITRLGYFGIDTDGSLDLTDNTRILLLYLLFDSPPPKKQSGVVTAGAGSSAVPGLSLFVD